MNTILTRLDIKTNLAISKVVSGYTNGTVSEQDIENLRKRFANASFLYSKNNFINQVNIPLLNILFPIFLVKWKSVEDKTEVQRQFMNLYNELFHDFECLSVDFLFELVNSYDLLIKHSRDELNDDQPILISFQKLFDYAEKYAGNTGVKLSVCSFIMNNIVMSSKLGSKPYFIQLLDRVTKVLEDAQDNTDVFHMCEQHLFINDWRASF